MAYGINIVEEPLRSAAFGAIVAGYSTVGGPFLHPIRIMIFQNLTDAGVILSFDPAIAVGQYIIPANGYILLDISSDRVGDGAAFKEKGAQVYVKRASGAPTVGNFYVTCLYALGD